MTGPSSPEGGPPSEDRPVAASAAPGLTTFSIEGRRAPALFVVGWLGVIASVGLASLALFGPAGTGGSIFWLITFLTASVGLILLGGSESIERRASGAAYSGPSPLLVLLTALVVTQVAGFVVGLPLQAVASAIPREVGDLIAVGVQAIVFVGVIRLMVVGTGALSWRDMGFVGDRATALRGMTFGALLAGPMIVVTGVVTLVVVSIVGVTPESPLPPTGTALGAILHLVAGALIAPFAEELLFRGFALTAWRRTRGVRAALVRSSIVFVLGHVLFVGGDQFDDALKLAIVAGVVRVPIAFGLGWLFVRSGSIWASLGLHAGFNGFLIAVGEVYAAAG